MRAALIVGDGVDLVHDHRFDVAQDGAALFGRQQNVERFRGGHQNMRRSHQHLAALVHQRVAGAHADADFGHQQAALAGFLKNFAERNLEIFLDVVAQGLQRRNVKHFGGVLQFSGQRFAHQTVDAGKKGGESLARSGGRGNYRGAPGQDVRPAQFLRLCRRREALEEPLADDRMRPVERLTGGRAVRALNDRKSFGRVRSHLLIVARRRREREAAHPECRP